MAIYEYRADDGELIEVVRGMKDEHPETIERDGKLYRRVWGTGVGGIGPKEYATTYKGDGPPVSHAIPRVDTSKGKEAGGVIEYAGGLKSDRRGKPIIANKADAANWSAASGYKRED